MNIFRLLGDLSHVAAIVLLLLKIWKTRSAAGEAPPSRHASTAEASLASPPPPPCPLPA